MTNKGILIVVSGPSGVGKGTVLDYVFKKDNRLVYSVSSTTRAARPGEIDGVHYNFITKQKFEQNITEGKMLEYANYCGNYYGTNAEYVQNVLNNNKDVVLEIEVQGALQIMQKCPDAVTLFICPPSVEELKNRLSGRGTESAEIINERINRSLEELSFVDKYKYKVINNTVKQAGDEILKILAAERNKNN